MDETHRTETVALVAASECKNVVAEGVVCCQSVIYHAPGLGLIQSGIGRQSGED